MTKKVNYILDADIKGFFDNVDYNWLMEFLRHDIGNKNFLRYVSRFLKSGIIENLKYYESDKGTPQGGLISPVLAEDKTRILPFGGFKGKKESFDFLGFAHHNSRTRTNKYTIQHKISKKKKKAKKQAMKQWLKENMHENLVDVIERLNRKLVGMYAYYGINGMFNDLLGLYKYVKYELYRVMCRRSQKKIKVKKYMLILERIPIAKPKIYVQIW